MVIHLTPLDLPLHSTSPFLKNASSYNPETQIVAAGAYNSGFQNFFPKMMLRKVSPNILTSSHHERCPR